MTKKTYIPPQIEDISLNISHLLLGTGGNNKGNGDDIGGEDIGAKEWGSNIWSEDEE